jgi:hypothetical protein
LTVAARADGSLMEDPEKRLYREALVAGEIG